MKTHDEFCTEISDLGDLVLKKQMEQERLIHLRDSTYPEKIIAPYKPERWVKIPKKDLKGKDTWIPQY